MPTENDRRLSIAVESAAVAGELILQHYQATDLAVERKGDDSPVTVADRGAEQLLRDRISEAFPEDGILGEELAEKPSTNGFRWILDPIDGTKAFIHGVPLFGTLIGLERDGMVQLGVCRFPALGEVIYAARGGGAWWQRGSEARQAARVSETSELSQAASCFTDVDAWVETGRLPQFEWLRSASRITRGWGDCYGHMLVATGRADVMADPLLNAWDAAALVPIVEEAGGCFFDWNGDCSIHTGNGISTNSVLKEAVLACFSDPECA